MNDQEDGADDPAGPESEAVDGAVHRIAIAQIQIAYH
jgi:hypothetical protein